MPVVTYEEKAIVCTDCSFRLYVVVNPSGVFAEHPENHCVNSGDSFVIKATVLQKAVEHAAS